jgi:hypothetical protein
MECPHCNYTLDFDEEPDANEICEGNTVEVDCPECKKSFNAKWDWEVEEVQ